MRGRFALNIPEIVLNTLLASEYVIAEQSSVLADIVIHPELAGMNWFELNRIEEFVRAGEEAAEGVLSAIQNLVEAA